MSLDLRGKIGLPLQEVYRLLLDEQLRNFMQKPTLSSLVAK